jgi:hypothetical protein
MVYVMDKSAAIAVADRSKIDMEGRMYEYEDHVKIFYTKWYSFDQSTFESNINTALYLIGDRGKQLLDDYKESEVHKNLVQLNMEVDVRITRVLVDMNNWPKQGIIEGVQTIKRSMGQVSRNMYCRFTLYDVSRSRENPHGVLIENWEIYNNSTVENGK